MTDLTAETFIQWKGTDLCMDLYCGCGYHSHIDGYFAYHVRCPECGTVFKMPTDLPLVAVEPDDEDIVAQDCSIAIIVDGVEVGDQGGDSDGRPWRELKLIPSFRAARAGERRADV